MRVTTTVPATLLKALEERAMHEGRSLSNLVAHLLENSIDTNRRP